MADNFRFLVCHSVTGVRIGYVDLSDVIFNDPLDGTGAVLTAKARIGPSQDAPRLSALIQKQIYALYVEVDGLSYYPFGGPILKCPWNTAGQYMEITANHWKWWLYQRFVGPVTAADPPTDTKYSWTATDQFAIAKALVTNAVGDNGCPNIIRDAGTSGVVRDLNFQGSELKKCGDLIDSMGDRDKGFDWNVECRINNGLPELHLGLYYPAKANKLSTLALISTPGAANYVLPQDPADTSENFASRVWATGAGSPPDQKFVYDEDPKVGRGEMLLIETSTSYSSVSVPATLSDHAIAERMYRGDSIQVAEPVVSLDLIDFTVQSTGDRVRFQLDNGMMKLNLEGVRVIDRTFSINSDAVDSCTLQLRLTDDELPTQDDLAADGS